jgi:xanthine dehydrogenase YagR molybdenum-binding subunit
MTAAIGRPLARTEGRDKVTGRALYSYEYGVEGACYGWIVGATVAAGAVRDVDATAALAEPGVLAVIWHGNAPKLAPQEDAELAVLQSGQVAYRGQIVALVVATGIEAARAAAALVTVDYDERPHTSVLRADAPDLYAPERLNAGFETDTRDGDVEAALRSADVVVDETYTTPALHNNAMEPHATIARWDDGTLTVWDSNQSPSSVAGTLRGMFGLDEEQVHVITEHVGGGFGSKGTARPNVVLAAMAARQVGRPVKLALTRQMMFALVGYRTPTIQRVRLGATADGRLTAISHQVVEQTSRLMEFAEQTGESTRHMYAAPNRLVTHRLARLNVPTPRWMRAPGEAPGMYAVESAIDELAAATGVDPVELRLRNEPEVDPATGDAFTSRHYAQCLIEGARRFGWRQRNKRACTGTGTGVAGSTYPAMVMPSSARVEARRDGTFDVSTAAADIGQGARTVLRQIAADALRVEVDRVRVHLGDSTLPKASTAGGSSGTASWGWAITRACTRMREQLRLREGIPADGMSVTADTADELDARQDVPRQAFGAIFVEVSVDRDSAEVRVLRTLGVFAVGRVMNPRLARSQLIGGMTMGLSMGLLEEGVLDARHGDYANHDLAGYHVAANADIREIEAVWLDEQDPDLNPMGGKGIGEIGIVGTAAAVTNAVYDATGIRVRDLPVRLDKLLPSP